MPLDLRLVLLVHSTIPKFVDRLCWASVGDGGVPTSAATTTNNSNSSNDGSSGSKRRRSGRRRRRRRKRVWDDEWRAVRMIGYTHSLLIRAAIPQVATPRGQARVGPPSGTPL
jgi:hypothetical protein